MFFVMFFCGPVSRDFSSPTHGPDGDPRLPALQEAEAVARGLQGQCTTSIFCKVGEMYIFQLNSDSFDPFLVLCLLLNDAFYNSRNILQKSQGKNQKKQLLSTRGARKGAGQTPAGETQQPEDRVDPGQFLCSPASLHTMKSADMLYNNQSFIVSFRSTLMKDRELPHIHL